MYCMFVIHALIQIIALEGTIEQNRGERWIMMITSIRRVILGDVAACFERRHLT